MWRRLKTWTRQPIRHTYTANWWFCPIISSSHYYGCYKTYKFHIGRQLTQTRAASIYFVVFAATRRPTNLTLSHACSLLPRGLLYSIHSHHNCIVLFVNWIQCTCNRCCVILLYTCEATELLLISIASELFIHLPHRGNDWLLRVCIALKLFLRFTGEFYVCVSYAVIILHTIHAHFARFVSLIVFWCRSQRNEKINKTRSTILRTEFVRLIFIRPLTMEGFEFTNYLLLCFVGSRMKWFRLKTRSLMVIGHIITKIHFRICGTFTFWIHFEIVLNIIYSASMQSQEYSVSAAADRKLANACVCAKNGKRIKKKKIFSRRHPLPSSHH